MITNAFPNEVNQAFGLLPNDGNLLSPIQMKSESFKQNFETHLIRLYRICEKIGVSCRKCKFK